jgi:hypothetical protein
MFADMEPIDILRQNWVRKYLRIEKESPLAEFHVRSSRYGYIALLKFFIHNLLKQNG